jgi:hypothetical protein
MMRTFLCWRLLWYRKQSATQSALNTVWRATSRALQGTRDQLYGPWHSTFKPFVLSVRIQNSEPNQNLKKKRKKEESKALLELTAAKSTSSL